MTSDQHRTTMPALLMRVIENTLNDETLTPVERFNATVLITFGYGLWDQQESIDPTSMAIPNEDWKQIGDWLMNMPGQRWRSDIDRVNWALDWMNRGPSAYEPEKEVTGDALPRSACGGCGHDLVYTPDGWQHDAAPWVWGDDHSPDPDLDGIAAAGEIRAIWNANEAKEVPGG